MDNQELSVRFDYKGVKTTNNLGLYKIINIIVIFIK